MALKPKTESREQVHAGARAVKQNGSVSLTAGMGLERACSTGAMPSRSMMHPISSAAQMTAVGGWQIVAVN